MTKLIILPNKKKAPLGLIFNLNENLTKKSLCDILLLNNVEISHFCEKFGKCNTCKIQIKEGFKFINNLDQEEKETLNKYFIYDKYTRLSCQVYINNNFNLIINIP